MKPDSAHPAAPLAGSTCYLARDPASWVRIYDPSAPLAADELGDALLIGAGGALQELRNTVVGYCMHVNADESAYSSFVQKRSGAWEIYSSDKPLSDAGRAQLKREITAGALVRVDLDPVSNIHY